MNPTWPRPNACCRAASRARPIGIGNGLAALAVACSLGGFQLAAAAEPVDFDRDVKPILTANCFRCHGADKQESGLRLDSPGALTAGGNAGPAFVAGKADDSLLIQAVTGAADVSKMPPEGPGLTPQQIGTLKSWVEQARKLPDELATVAAPARNTHWSFQPLAAAPPPATKNPNWIRSPIDAFVLARLEAAGLEPSPEADQATLVRRLSLDLLGLPPTVAEIDQFLADQRPAPTSAWSIGC